MECWKVLSPLAVLCCSIAIGASGAIGAPGDSGIDRRGIDESVRPQDNLFLYANGEWLRHTPIPADRSNFGAFEILQDEAELNIRQIVADAVASDSPLGSNQQRIGDFFLSYMDEAAIDRRGLLPLAEELSRIQQIASKAELIEHIGYLQTLDVKTPIGFYVDQDDKNSSAHLVVLVQYGLTLPDRDYYLQEGEKYESARTAFEQYVTKLFELSDFSGGADAAEAILQLETKLAKVQWTRTQMRDAQKRYNKVAFAELAERTGEFPWPAFFEGAQVDAPEYLNMSTPSFFVALEQIVDETPLAVWKNYLTFQLLHAYAPALSAPYVDAHHRLFGTELGGIPKLKPRWKRAVQTVSGSRGFGVLGDAVGQIYVERHFPQQAQDRMAELVANLLRAYQLSIHELTWMTDETKEKAAIKLGKITTKLGYTKRWRDYSQLEIKKDDLVGNLMRSARVEYGRMIDKLGQPVDRDLWHMTPQTVNAYYSPNSNEIVFPAAILQPPYFQLGIDDAANYGSIGAVIGHEISHAFDDQGSKYDGDGNLVDWWTGKDRVAFTQLTSRIVDQFDGYSPLEGKHVNGRLTLGENIADLSGMSIAYKAYLLSLDGKPSPVIDGWTGPQRFFISWGQSWRRKYRDAEMVNRLLTDPHSPAQYRGNGPCVNFDPFYEAFGVKRGDGLFRAESERIRVW